MFSTWILKWNSNIEKKHDYTKYIGGMSAMIGRWCWVYSLSSEPTKPARGVVRLPDSDSSRFISVSYLHNRVAARGKQ